MRYATVLLLLLCTGCTLFPREQSTRAVETTWLTLHTVDTLQTMQIAKHPECFSERNPLAAAIYGDKHPSESRVLLTNVVLGALHSVVSRWIDDGREASFAAEDGNEALWSLGRLAWHGASIFGTGTAVAGNFSIGLGPTSARCRP